jgi:hypothetical protein
MTLQISDLNVSVFYNHREISGSRKGTRETPVEMSVRRDYILPWDREFKPHLGCTYISFAVIMLSRVGRRIAKGWPGGGLRNKPALGILDQLDRYVLSYEIRRRSKFYRVLTMVYSTQNYWVLDFVHHPVL